MSLTDEERRAYEDRFRAEVEQEEARRAALASKQDERTRQKEQEERAAEVAGLRLQVRQRFWEEKGYVRHIDSRGAESWIRPEEHARRLKHRQQRTKRATANLLYGERARQLVLVVTLVFLAFVAGLFAS
jgi:hypothetical protein